jgi:mono/diheme cytochrome c family protein
MRYFFLAYAIIVVMVVGYLGVPGAQTSRRPLEIFPDMDRQDKVKAQAHEGFFADNQGDRLPVAGTAPRGYSTAETVAVEGGMSEPEFSPGRTSYHATGAIGEFFGTGMPEELGLTAENVGAFLRRGQERYAVSCLPCHGASGDGQGTVAQLGVPGVANLMNMVSATYPDGRMFEVITHGKGLMAPYGYNIAVDDRWAIIAYIRALQTARQAPYEELSAEIRTLLESAGK